MKEQLIKLQDYYQNQPSNVVSMVQTGGPSPADEHKLALKQWQYCQSLAKHMYQVPIFSGIRGLRFLIEWGKVKGYKFCRKVYWRDRRCYNGFWIC